MQTLYFPKTNPSAATLRRLLLFFATVHFYQPMEGAVPDGVETLVTAGLCHGYPPIPFGPDLDRFKRLLKDLQSHGDEYSGGMLASLAKHSRPNLDEESVSRLIAGMSGSEQAAGDAAEKEVLWRARLLLALAARLDREQQDLAEGLQDLTHKEEALFDAIKGEDDREEFDTSFSALQMIGDLTPRPVQAGQLLKAWGQLFIRDSAASSSLLLATDRQEAADAILEICAEQAHVIPVRLATFPLPDMISGEKEVVDWQAAFIDDRNILRNRAGDCLGHWAELVRQAAESSSASAGLGQVVLDEFGRQSERWTELVSTHLQAGLKPAMLTLYLLPDLSSRRLFRRIVDGAEAFGTPEAPAGNGVLAVLSDE